jgi:drug/metabolite transporter (DMT)-like permease
MATHPIKPNHAIELALLATLATLWASSYTFIKIGIETIPPVTLIAARTLIAGGILMLVMRWRGIRLPRDGANWRNFAVQACLNSVVPFTLIAWAEKSIDAGLAVILNSMTPVFTFLITWAWSRHEPTPLRKFTGIVLGLGGTCIIVGGQAFAHVGQELAAQLAVVLATMCYAGAAIFGRNFKNLDPIAPAAGSLLSGAMILLPLSLVVDRPWTLVPS